MFDRTGIAAYAAIMASCVAGILHLSPWAIVFSACALMLLSILKKHDQTFSRLGTSATVQGVVMVSSVVNAALIAGAGYGLGVAVCFIWNLA